MTISDDIPCVYGLLLERYIIIKPLLFFLFFLRCNIIGRNYLIFKLTTFGLKYYLSRCG